MSHVGDTVCVLLVLSLPLKGLASYQDQRRLLNDTYIGYNSMFRPVLNQSDTVHVMTTFDLRSIHQLDERNQKLVVSGWFTFIWKDELLTWEPSKYGNITKFIAEDFWKPDAVLYNGYYELKDLRKTSFNAIVSQDGHVQWAPGGTLETHCNISVAFYPFDIQKCQIEIMLWHSTDDQVDLVSPPDGVHRTSSMVNGEWEIRDSSVRKVQFGCCNGSYSKLSFSLTLVRRRAFFVINMLVPAIAESVLCNLVFLVPSESGERMSLSMTVFLSYTVFLSATSDSLPRTSLTVSIMSVYMLTVLVLGTVCVFLSGVSLYLYHHDRQESKMNNALHDYNLQCFPIKVQGTPSSSTKLKAMNSFKEQSRRFDRICLRVISSLTLVSVSCLVTILATHT